MSEAISQTEIKFYPKAGHAEKVQDDNSIPLCKILQKGGTGSIPESHGDGFKCFQSKKALQTEWLQQIFSAYSENKTIKQVECAGGLARTLAPKKTPNSAICCGI